LHNKLSTHNTIRKYFVGNLLTAAPPQYSPAIRLWLSSTTFKNLSRKLPNFLKLRGG